MRPRTWAAVAAGIVVVAAAVLATVAVLRRPPAAPVVVEASIGDAKLHYLQTYARRPAAREGGQLDRLELAALFPRFEPAGELAGLTAETDVRARTDHTLFFTIAPAEDTLDPAERPTRLYARFLGEPAAPRADGLVERRLEPGSPYETEDLFIAPPEGRVFFARCPQAGRKADRLPVSCLYDFRISGLDVQLRFSSVLLAQWRELAGAAHDFVGRLLH